MREEGNQTRKISLEKFLLGKVLTREVSTGKSLLDEQQTRGACEIWLSSLENCKSESLDQKFCIITQSPHRLPCSKSCSLIGWSVYRRSWPLGLGRTMRRCPNRSGWRRCSSALEWTAAASRCPGRHSPGPSHSSAAQNRSGIDLNRSKCSHCGGGKQVRSDRLEWRSEEVEGG